MAVCCIIKYIHNKCCGLILVPTARHAADTATAADSSTGQTAPAAALKYELHHLKVTLHYYLCSYLLKECDGD